MALVPEEETKLLELIQKAHDNSNPDQVSDLKNLGGTIYGTFEKLLKSHVKKTLYKPKDDYVDKIVMSYIDERIIKQKSLKNCSNITMIIGWLKNGIHWHVKSALINEKKNNPKQHKTYSIYTQGDSANEGSMIHTEADIKLSNEYIEMPDEIIEKEELLEIIRRHLTEIEQRDSIGAKVINIWLGNDKITNKQMVEKIKVIFQESDITEEAITKRLSMEPGRSLYNFIHDLLKELKENKPVDDVIKNLKKINKISKDEAMKKKQENENGGKEL